MKRLNLLKLIMNLMRRKERAEMEVIIRVAAREGGMSRNWEEVLLAVIKCESNLDPNAVCKNKDGTFDYGLCQYNSYWYISKGMITKEDAFNPEKAVKLMVEQFKKGRARDWVCYKFDKYQKHLPRNLRV